MASSRAKRSETWVPGVLVEHVWSTFDIAALKVIWGVIWCIGPKFGPNGKRQEKHFRVVRDTHVFTIGH